MKLRVLPDLLAVCRLEPDAAVPAWFPARGLRSATWTADELSLICLDSSAPRSGRVERGWRALMVEGPLDFALTGVMSSLASPLAAARISLFAISTFDTDYLLVRDLEGALKALRGAGHSIES